MPLTERTPKHVDTTRSHSIGTMEFFRGGESSRRSPPYSPTTPTTPSSPYFKHQDLEEDYGLYQRKSVLAKVKEKARKLRYSLSKRRQEDENLTPSWGVTLEDAGEEEDAEYLGAPMYESEVAPEVYKENARQHPRANPVISEKHVLHSNVNAKTEQQVQDQYKPLSPVKSTTTTQPSATNTNTATTTTATTPAPINVTRNEKVAEKLIPAYAEGLEEDAANSISSKFQGLAVSRTPSMASQTSSPSSAPLRSSSSLPVIGKNTSPKGAISLKIKFEPGGDENAFSEVISEAISPRKTPGHAGVMEKVREAVNSLLGNEEPPSQQCAPNTNATHASSQKTNARGVGQKGNHGGLLQAN